MHYWARRAAISLVVVVVAIATAVGCGSDDDSSTATGGASTSASTTTAKEPTGKPYVMGFVGSLSSPLQAYGRAILSGAQAYVAKVNAEGGINGHPLKLESLDYGLGQDPTQVASAVRQLKARSDPSVIIGFNVGVIPEEVLKADVPVVAGLGNPGFLESPQYFAIDLPLSWEPTAWVSFAKANLEEAAEGKTPAIAASAIDAPDNVTAIKNLETLASQNDWSVAFSKTFTLTGDPGAVFAEQARSGADIIFDCGFDANAPQMVQISRQQGYQGPFVEGLNCVAYPTLKAINDPNYYAGRPFGFATDDTPGAKEFTKWMDDIGADPNGSLQLFEGWASGAVVAAAMKACGFPCPGEKLTTELAKVKLDDLGGLAAEPLDFTDDRIAVASEFFYRWSGDKPERVGDSYQGGPPE